MSGCWSRVFSGGVTSGCSTDCYNSTSPDQGSTKPTIFDEAPVSLASVGEGIAYWAEQLRRRLAASATITSSTELLYTITLRRGTRTDTITWQISNQQGAYPLITNYTTPFDTGTANHQRIINAIDWLVEALA